MGTKKQVEMYEMFKDLSEKINKGIVLNDYRKGVFDTLSFLFEKNTDNKIKEDLFKSINGDITIMIKSTKKNQGYEMTLVDGKRIISTRLLNVILSNDEFFPNPNEWRTTPIKDILSRLSINRLMSCRGFDKRTLKELQNICYHVGIKLKP